MSIQVQEKHSAKLKFQLQELGQQIGNTPLLPVTRLFNKAGVNVYAKAEWQQLSGSVKARAAFRIIKHAVQEGAFDNGAALLDATSGNTGIAYATIGAELGLPVTLCLPENATAERKRILESLGAEIIYTSRFGGTDEAQEMASSLAAKFPDKYFYADQYKNNENWKAHYHTTALEIVETLPQITHFVSGLGTTGTFTGTGRRLKEFDPAIQLISLQPNLALHGLEGWKHLETADVPKIYDPNLADYNLDISTAEAYHVIKEAAKKEGWLLSPSSAANLAGAIAVANQLTAGNIVTILPDNADRYNEIIKQLL